MGTRVLELMVWRTEGSSKAPKRETRFLPALMSIHTQVWKSVFGKPADAIEKSVENDGECALSLCRERDTIVSPFAPLDMIIDNDPPITRFVSVPRDMSQLSCSSLSAGIVEAVLDGLGFVNPFAPLWNASFSPSFYLRSPPELRRTTPPRARTLHGQPSSLNSKDLL